jgi:hypothetical protein
MSKVILKECKCGVTFNARFSISQTKCNHCVEQAKKDKALGRVLAKLEE